MATNGEDNHEGDQSKPSDQDQMKQPALSEKEQEELNKSLYDSAESGSIEKVRELLSAGRAHVNYQGGEWDDTPLSQASENGHTEVVRLLLQYNADPNIRDGVGYTPLHGAGNKDVAELLIDNNADISALTRDGDTVLHWTSFHGRISALKLIIDKGGRNLIDTVNERGETPLHMAGNEEVAEYLIECGADISAVTTVDGDTVLHSTAKDGRHRALDFFCKKSGLNIDTLNKHGKTPLHMAGDEETVKCLVGHGADVRALSTRGETPLHTARSKDVAAHLVSCGADIKALSTHGETPLHTARNENIAKYLVSCGADIKALSTEDGNSVLHMACQYGRWYSILEYYIKAGLSLDTPNKSNQTPIDILKSPSDDKRISERRQQCLERLIDKGYYKEPNDSSDASEPTQSKDEAKENGFAKGNPGTVESLKQQEAKALKQQEAKAVFDKAMRSGSGQLTQSNITMHGPGGAGKTSVIRLIAGMDPLPKDQQNATDIMEPAIRAMSTTKLQEFEVIENSKYLSILADLILDRQNTKDEDKSRNLSPIEKDIGKHSNDISKQAMTPIKTGIIGQSEPQPEDTTIVGEMKALDKLMGALEHAKPSSNMFKSQWFHLIDSGGQPQFLDILPLIYSCFSLHVVVMRLTDGLDKRCPVQFYCKGEDEMQRCNLPDELCMTNREMINLACQIATNAAESASRRVMIIGTHVDELESSQRDSILKGINKGLAEEKKKFANVLICKSQKETVFALNAVAEGEERRKYVKELQTCISENTKSVKKIDIPLKWLAFQVALSSNMNEEGIIQLTECYKIADKVHINRDEVPEVLKFLSSIALIHFFPNHLPDLVFTKMDILISKVSKLVKASFAPSSYTICGPSERLKNTGIFNIEYLREILGDMANDVLTETRFLTLLCNLKITAHVKGKADEYFLPSALSLVPCSKETPKAASVPSVFRCGVADRFLPHGFFFNVVMELLSGQCVLPFELRPDIEFQHREEIQLCVSERRVPGVIKLRNRSSWIQLSYSNDPQNCPQIYKAVREAIERSVERFKEHTGLNMPTDEPRLLLCPMCTVQDHYCFISEDNKVLSCSINTLATRDVERKSMLCWWQSDQEKDCKDKAVTVDGKDLNYVCFNLLRKKTAYWSNIGRELGVRLNDRDSLKKDVSLDDSDRLERVIAKWQESHPSWDQFITALKNLEYNDILAKVEGQQC